MLPSLSPRVVAKMARKGKEVAGKAPAGKRKRGGDDDKSGSVWNKRNREILQFFEDVAAEANDTDDSVYSDLDDCALSLSLYPYLSVAFSLLCFLMVHCICFRVSLGIY